MENASYISISRQIGLFNNFDVVANNIANTNTTAYKRHSLLFKEYIDDSKNKSLSFSQDHKLFRDNTSGTMKKTGNIFDIAIATPQHYFAVDTPAGVRYTQDGSLHLDNANRLVTKDEFPILTINNENIVINNNYKEVVIGNTGNVMIDGNLVGQIGVFNLSDDNLIKKTGDSLVNYDGQPDELGENIKIVQGYIEDSNVVPVVAMGHMLNTSRNMEEVANVLSSINKLSHNCIEVLMQMK